MSSRIETFDEFNDTEQLGDSQIVPFQFKKDQTEHDWLMEWWDQARQMSQSRFDTYKRYMSLYKGIHWKGDTTDGRNPKMTVNFIHEYLEAKVSQRGRRKINVAVMPNNDEQDDINNAKACKMFLDARAMDINLDKAHQDMDRAMFNLGHAFMYVPWNPDIGDESPIYKRIKERYEGGKVPKSVTKKLGKEGMIKIGDVEALPVGADRVFPEIGRKHWSDVDYVNFIEWKHIEEVRAEYPNAEVEGDSANEYFIDINGYDNYQDHVLVHHFWHRDTKHLCGGRYIKWIESDILESTEHPYEDMELPFIPDTDIDVYGEFWGRSFISNIEKMQQMYNIVQSGTARDFTLASAAKWLVPKGSVRKESLNNSSSVLEYSGAQSPRLENRNPVNPAAYELQDRLEKKMSQFSTVYDISKGEVPTGVTANSALRFLDEQETQRDSTGSAKRGQRVVSVYRMMLSRMKQFYKESDGRTIRILGSKNEYMIKSFKGADFTKTYDVKIENSSALPDTKTGRISTIIDLNIATQTDPVFGREDVIQMLDLGLDDSFKDRATAPVDSAREALDSILDGEGSPEPQVYDDFLVHYDVFMDYVQKISFKTKVEEEIQKNVLSYIMTLEGLMWNRSMKNPKFAQQLMMLNNYPVLFEIPMPLGPPPMEEPGTAPGGVDTADMKKKNEAKQQQGEVNG